MLAMIVALVMSLIERVLLCGSFLIITAIIGYYLTTDAMLGGLGRGVVLVWLG